MSLATLKTRIDYAGGDNLGRIKKQKLNSFLAALKNDYNSREIELENGTHCQCLINTNDLSLLTIFKSPPFIALRTFLTVSNITLPALLILSIIPSSAII